jgi:cyclic pyranopterin phosphate synthase
MAKKTKSVATLSHVSHDDRPVMVDVTDKPQSFRRARAQGFITLRPETIALIGERKMRKGNVLTTAELAGVMAAKKTSDAIPLCHPLQLTDVDVKATIVNDPRKPRSSGIEVVASVACVGQTGVEMEALHAASVALLTVYDMCKAVDKKMVISRIALIEKTKVAR